MIQEQQMSVLPTNNRIISFFKTKGILSNGFISMIQKNPMIGTIKRIKTKKIIKKTSFIFFGILSKIDVYCSDLKNQEITRFIHKGI